MFTVSGGAPLAPCTSVAFRRRRVRSSSRKRGIDRTRVGITKSNSGLYSASLGRKLNPTLGPSRPTSCSALLLGREVLLTQVKGEAELRPIGRRENFCVREMSRKTGSEVLPVIVGRDPRDPACRRDALFPVKILSREGRLLVSVTKNPLLLGLVHSSSVL